jgi:predicted  nucleic acid-binding Zn-ribbon protein
MVTRIAAAGVLIGAAAIGGSIVGRAQQAQSSPDVLPALLVEVRGLRAAMEQMASAGPRVQLVLGRLQLQEQRIDTQVRRLDTVKAALTDAQRELNDREQRMKAVQQLIESFPNSEGRRDLEHELTQLKVESARRRMEVQRLSNEEALLTQDIAAEQARWTDFNQRLEELERSLSRR